MGNEDRVAWLGNAKAIAILLVVFGHYIDTPGVRAYVYSFHMPLFFYLSGFVHSERHPFWEYVRRRMKTLLLPYFIFAGLNYAFFLIRRQYGDSPEPGTPIQKLIDIFTWNEFWFLGCLCLVSIGFWAIAHTMKTARGVLGLALAGTAVHFLLSRFCSDYVHHNLIKCFVAIVFYAAGFYLRHRPHGVSVSSMANAHPIAALALVMGNLLVAYWGFRRYGEMDMTFSGDYAYYYVAAFSGIAITCTVAQFLTANVFLNFIGANTILIYLLEGYPPAVIRRFMIHAFNIDNFRWITFSYACVYTVMTVMVLVPFIVLINRYAPLVIGRERARSASPPQPIPAG